MASTLEPIRSVALIRRVSGPLLRRAGIFGVLEVPRRRTGTAQICSLFMVKVAGELYVVALGGETDWALNLRAAGRAVLMRGTKRVACSATEVMGEERDRAIAAYLGSFPPLKRDYNRRPEAQHHPTFRLEPVKPGP